MKASVLGLDINGDYEMNSEDTISKFYVVIDYHTGHKAVNRYTGNEFMLTSSEIHEYLEYASEVWENIPSYYKCLAALDNFILNLIA